MVTEEEENRARLYAERMASLPELTLAFIDEQLRDFTREGAIVGRACRVTRESAGAILAQRVRAGARRPDWYYVELHARKLAAVAEGKHEPGGYSMVLFAQDGQLEDGGYFLEAVARAGVPVPCMAAFGITPGASSRIDSGAARGPARNGASSYMDVPSDPAAAFTVAMRARASLTEQITDARPGSPEEASLRAARRAFREFVDSAGHYGANYSADPALFTRKLSALREALRDSARNDKDGDDDGSEGPHAG